MKRKTINTPIYLAAANDVDGYQMNQYDEDMIFMEKASTNKDKDKENDKEEVVLPALLVYGVSVTLVGLFLIVLPIPACKDWGGKLVLAGVTACANSISSRVDENNKRGKDKEKK